MARTVDVTVCTPTIPGREAWLEEARDSVRDQTTSPRSHLVDCGPVSWPAGMPDVVKRRNRMLGHVETEWVAVLDDDDVYDPWHFETIEPWLSDGIDVIYAFCHEIEGINVNAWSRETLAGEIERSNPIFSNACIRTSKLREVGGWSIEGWDPGTHLYRGGPVCMEDWDLWVRMARAGASFLCVPTKTWHYRDVAPERMGQIASRLMSRPGAGVGFLHG